MRSEREFSERVLDISKVEEKEKAAEWTRWRRVG